MMHLDAAPNVGAVATLKVSLEFLSFDNNFHLCEGGLVSQIQPR